MRLEACRKNQHEPKGAPASARSRPTVALVLLGESTPSALDELLERLGGRTDAPIHSVSIIVEPPEGNADRSSAEFPTVLREVPISTSSGLDLSQLTFGAHPGAEADQILFLRPGIQLDPSVLADLSRRLEDPDVGAVAPEIHRAASPEGRSSSLLSAGLKLCVGPASGSPRAYDLGESAGVSSGGFGVEDMPAASLSCLLVRRSDLITVGGLAAGAPQNSAALDLCLRLRSQLGLATLVDHELRATAPRDLATHRPTRMPRANRQGPRRDLSGLFLRRRLFEDKLNNRRLYSDEPLRIALVEDPSSGSGGQPDPELRQFFESKMGWRVERTPPDLTSPVIANADVILSSSPRFIPEDLPTRRLTLLTIAWTDGSGRWDEAIDRNLYDLVISRDAAGRDHLEARLGFDVPVVAAEPNDLARGLADLLADFNRSGFRVVIKSPAPAGAASLVWGDYHFALALQRSLRRLGHPTRVDLLPDWYGSHNASAELVLVLRGISPYEPQPGQLNFMWNISHPEAVDPAEYEAYDHVFVASLTYPRALASLDVPVSPLLQCTDPRLFYPDPGPPQSSHPLLFVGNSRRQPRPIVMDAIEAELPLAVYGKLWEGIIDEKYVVGEHIPNELLRRHYSSAHVVLNDHWSDMREWGFLSNRLFDAGACGACIISDPAAGLHELFGDAVQSYETVEDLRAIVQGLLTDDSTRKAQGQRLRELVLREHTFDRRAAVIIETARALTEQAGLRIHTSIEDAAAPKSGAST